MFRFNSSLNAFEPGEPGPNRISRTDPVSTPPEVAAMKWLESIFIILIYLT